MRNFLPVLLATLLSAAPAYAVPTVLPEPSIAGLFAGGVIGMVILRRLRRR